MVTQLNKIDGSANIQIVSSLPATPAKFYGINASDTDSLEWKGGEVVYHSGDSRIYLQTATSGL